VLRIPHEAPDGGPSDLFCFPSGLKHQRIPSLLTQARLYLVDEDFKREERKLKALPGIPSFLSGSVPMRRAGKPAKAGEPRRCDALKVSRQVVKVKTCYVSTN